MPKLLEKAWHTFRVRIRRLFVMRDAAVQYDIP